MTPADLALCIPAYNAAAFLPRLLKSAAAQSVPFAEILVYDDCSSDSTSSVAEKWGARIFRGEKNLGCSCGKNILAQSARSAWLHFHDADDDLRPDFVEKAAPWLQQNSVDVVFFSYESRYHETNEPAGSRVFDDNALRRDPVAYVLQEQINPFCGLYRKGPFLRAGGWDEDPAILQAEDQAGHLRLALAGLRFAADPAQTVVNYLRAGSMTTGNLAGANRAVLEHITRALNQNLTMEQLAAAEQRLWPLAGLAAAYLDWPTAEKAARLAQRRGVPCPPTTGRLFRTLAPINVVLALRVREFLIRALRPGARTAPAFHPGRKPRS